MRKELFGNQSCSFCLFLPILRSIGGAGAQLFTLPASGAGGAPHSRLCIYCCSAVKFGSVGRNGNSPLEQVSLGFRRRRQRKPRRWPNPQTAAAPRPQSWRRSPPRSSAPSSPPDYHYTQPLLDSLSWQLFFLGGGAKGFRVRKPYLPMGFGPPPPGDWNPSKGRKKFSALFADFFCDLTNFSPKCAHNDGIFGRFLEAKNLVLGQRSVTHPDAPSFRCAPSHLPLHRTSSVGGAGGGGRKCIF